MPLGQVRELLGFIGIVLQFGARRKVGRAAEAPSLRPRAASTS